MKTRKWILFAAMFLCLTSCDSFYMTTDEFHSELNKINDSTINKSYNFQMGIIPGLIRGRQFNNGLKEIQLKYKDGEAFMLPVWSRTSATLILKNGKKKGFYFDTMFAKDSMVYGNISHFFGSPVGIPFKSIEKVEIQSK